MIQFPVWISEQMNGINCNWFFVSFQKLLDKIISELYVHLNRCCSLHPLSFPCPPFRASLFLKKMRQAALSIFIAESHSPPPPPPTLHLLTLVMWCWWSCHLKINSVWPLGSFLRRWRWQSLLQEAAFEMCCWGEALVVWYLTAFGFKCEIPGLILDSSCVGGTAARVLGREQNRGEGTLTWRQALFTQSRGKNKQTKNTVQNKPHCVTHCLCSEFRISVGFGFSDLKEEITGMPLDSDSFFNSLIILTKLAMIRDLTLLI